MDEDIIADFKQFIAVTVSQQTSDLRGDFNKMDVKLDKLSNRVDILSDKIDEVDVKLDTISAAVGERFEESTAKTTSQLDNHEVRITKLEHTPA